MVYPSSRVINFADYSGFIIGLDGGNWMVRLLMMLAGCAWSVLACAASPLPAIDPESPLYLVQVEPGVSYDDVVTSLNSAAAEKNLVSPATFPIGEHMRQRNLPLEGVLEVRSYCSLGVGAEILLDHPEFAVFAPCRIAIFHKAGALYLALDRPTFDLRYIQNPTSRAREAAQQLEQTLIWIIDKARKGEI